MLLLLLAAVVAVLGSACLKIEREHLYTANGNTFNFGEVKNDTDSYYEWVTVAGTYYDSAGNVIPSPSVPVRTCTNLVSPHDSSPFKLVAPPEQSIDRYELSVQGTPTTNVLPTYLSLQEVSPQEARTGGSCSGLLVSGSVKNNGDVTYNEVEVCAAFYKDGVVVERGFAYVQPGSPGPDDLGPGQVGSFSIRGSLPEGTTEFRLWVDGAQLGSSNSSVMAISTAMMSLP